MEIEGTSRSWGKRRLRAVWRFTPNDTRIGKVPGFVKKRFNLRGVETLVRGGVRRQAKRRDPSDMK